MSYELRFKEEALAEWRRLDGSLREQFKKKLIERLAQPRVLSAKLSGHLIGTRSSCAVPDTGCSMRCVTAS
jgi:mRNA-degrading endonuclease RelE of RelBE toxin-antitoxin system